MLDKMHQGEIKLNFAQHNFLIVDINSCLDGAHFRFVKQSRFFSCYKTFLTIIITSIYNFQFDYDVALSSKI